MNAKSSQHSGREIVMTHGVLSENPEVLFYGKGWRVVRAVLQEAMLRLWNDDAFGLAGNVAFRALLALFPFLIFTSAMTAFIGDRAMADHLVDFLIAIIPSPLIEPLVSEVEKVMTVPRGGVLSIGILLTIWFAVGGVDGVRVGLNRAYGLHETRSVVVLYGLQIAMVILASLALVIVGYLLVLAPRAGSWMHALIPGFDPASVTVRLIRFPASATIFVVALFAAHVLLPARRTRFSNIWPGVVFTAVAWTFLATAFAFYVGSFGTYASYYAGMAGIIAALYFMYLAALLLIFGGELNRALRIRRLARALAN
ncbi:YihY/virulence factor BrkB family protein [Pelagivirga sediminicola]|uniref:YihY/virulence factor BrkB family protein n=1 Tax=Pelagivirga sediminicola TaxID=2170575 RepID=A0A2T7G490_9RHOB|nr:YihY/virulence factor BrkB family protein [Pelagivirga sediminicola]PVA09244.1 YihY/virulence factor BrkB family protein [Pelagivirga sediminicola]